MARDKIRFGLDFSSLLVAAAAAAAAASWPLFWSTAEVRKGDEAEKEEEEVEEVEAEDEFEDDELLVVELDDWHEELLCRLLAVLVLACLAAAAPLLLVVVVVVVVDVVVCAALGALGALERSVAANLSKIDCIALLLFTAPTLAASRPKSALARCWWRPKSVLLLLLLLFLLWPTQEAVGGPFTWPRAILKNFGMISLMRPGCCLDGVSSLIEKSQFFSQNNLFAPKSFLF